MSLIESYHHQKEKYRQVKNKSTYLINMIDIDDAKLYTPH